ncbi:MAG: PilN domain-containing protein [Methylococcales bacterium]|nr:PilN domain-containing protein [Methylococcales bacterium]
MSIQQVNLYQSSLKPEPFNIGLYLGIALASLLCIGLGIATVYLTRAVSDERYQVTQAVKQLNDEQARVKALEATLKKQAIDPALITELALWQKKVDDLKQTLATLGNGNSANSQGFSGYFQALANQSIAEVWLTTIRFDAEQQQIDLEGSTFKSDKIPDFLQQLQTEPVFHGRTFAQLHIEKSEAVPNLMNFKLSTHVEATKKDHVK